jgi:hypothetical protein
MVLRVTGGMFIALTAIAPEPTLLVTVLAALLVVTAEPKLGTPVILPGKTLERPPDPMTKNGVLIGVPLTPPLTTVPTPLPIDAGETNAPGKWNQQQITAGSEHDHTQVRDHRRQATFERAFSQIWTEAKAPLHGTRAPFPRFSAIGSNRSAHKKKPLARNCTAGPP